MPLSSDLVTIIGTSGKDTYKSEITRRRISSSIKADGILYILSSLPTTVRTPPLIFNIINKNCETLTGNGSCDGSNDVDVIHSIRQNYLIFFHSTWNTTPLSRQTDLSQFERSVIIEVRTRYFAIKKESVRINLPVKSISSTWDRMFSVVDDPFSFMSIL
ncbi:hypothetical protein RIR_jg29314.t1 [Rhizophagus irregularis DAOM 181602=DAOM 197198]|nr:hypothetical protein RIR_jg29314.t1 [Rhizophagus irregularis DAOM 181602=DAOM 197198]